MRSPIQDHLASLHARYANLSEGEVATYIPELATANTSWFGICVATADGHVYEVGDSRQEFTIQSISKPFVYGLAMEDRGTEAVNQRIGVEPTGDAFNSISLEPGSGRPLNPMINAGAITASSLIKGRSDEDRQQRLLDFFSQYAGRSLSLDEKTYLSEKETGHRNRAIGHMLRNFGIIEEDPERALDLYFRQCSILVNCRDLALMAATLACGGVHPVTRERAVRRDLVGNILSVMSTCGMYDFAGQWMYRVGLPAKSGVAGGVLAVMPGQLGIGVFSPPLDSRGNSVRGVRVCEDLARDMGLHFLSSVQTSLPPVHSRTSLRTLRSKCERPPSEQKVLDALGSMVGICKLQGDLRYSTSERVLREMSENFVGAETLVLDFVRVSAIDKVAQALLVEAHQRFAGAERSLLFSGLQAHAGFRRFIEEKLARGESYRRATFDDLDSTLEFCERRLLEAADSVSPHSAETALVTHALCEGLDPQQLAHLRGLMREERYAPGDLVVRRGDAADRLFLVTQGEVSVFVNLEDGQRRRLATIRAGSSFGEGATIFGGTRTADVYVNKPLHCWSLGREAFEDLEQGHPLIKIRLLQNLLRASTRVALRMTEEVAFLEGDLRRRAESVGANRS